ncbi:MAG: hypothetical protein OEY51_14085 [Cyclobacteriaceae bacterium]|nr:hypothetical protein [Cyclobacteriaceae bacterium]
MKKGKIRLFGIPLNQKTAVRWKIYLDRARVYIGYINFAMIGFVFLNSFQNPLVRDILDEHKLLIYPSVMFLFIIISLILGRLDTTLGIRKEEMKNYAEENPVMTNILESLEEIKKSQEKLLAERKVSR